MPFYHHSITDVKNKAWWLKVTTIPNKISFAVNTMPYTKVILRRRRRSLIWNYSQRSCTNQNDSTTIVVSKWALHPMRRAVVTSWVARTMPPHLLWSPSCTKKCANLRISVRCNWRPGVTTFRYSPSSIRWTCLHHQGFDASLTRI